MALGAKQLAQGTMDRLPVYRALAPGALRTYAALRYHSQHSSKAEITRYLHATGGIPTRYFSTAIIAARAAFATGQDDLLEDTLNSLEQRFPEAPRLHLLLADMHTYHGRYEQALRRAERSRLLQPSFTSALSRVVRLGYRVRGTDEADTVAIHAVRRFPRNAEILWAVANTCASPAQYARIYAAWQDRVPEPADLLRSVRQLAMAAARGGELDAAQGLYRHAIRLLADRERQAPRISEPRLEGRGAWRAVEDLCHLLDTAGVPFFFAAGTALGLVREGRPLSADGDIDVGVLDANWDRDALVALFTDHPRFDLVHHPLTQKVELRHRGGSPVDVFRFYPEDGRVWHDGVFVRWHNTPFDVHRREVGGLSVPLPAHADHYLTENYGDWRTPNPDFDAFTDDAPNVEVIWPEYLRLHLIRRAYKRLARGHRAAAAMELRRAEEPELATMIEATR